MDLIELKDNDFEYLNEVLKDLLNKKEIFNLIDEEFDSLQSNENSKLSEIIKLLIENIDQDKLDSLMEVINKNNKFKKILQNFLLEKII
jgi:16S rRNA U1498 N3-methylase RsmE